MSRLFARLGSAFVAPSPAAALDRRKGFSPPPPATPSVAVLCRSDEAGAVGGAAALALAQRRRSSTAVVVVWGATGGRPRAPAAVTGRRVAATLSARGHDAAATGRLVVVSLAADPEEAASEAVRAAAAAGDTPVVTVLAGPRHPSADALLRAQDTILVAQSDATVAELAVGGLARLGVPAHAVALPAGAPHARALAAAGVALVPPLRAAVEAGLEAMR